MANLNFRVGLFPYVNSRSSAAGDIASDPLTAGLAMTWYVQKFVPNQNLTVNRLSFINSAATGVVNPSYFVGITTSLGVHGMYPYTSNNIAGSAGSLGFITSAITTRFSASTLPFEVAVNEVTLNKEESYWLALQLIARTAGGTFQFSGIEGESHLNRRHQTTLTNSTGTITALTEYDLVVPGYYSGTGTTKWYLASGTQVYNDAYVTYGGAAYYEFGAKFELNNFLVQELELDSVIFGNIYPIDSNTQFTCRLYDHNRSVIGTAITERAFTPSGGTVTERGNFNFYFVPPVKIRPDFTYTVGIIGTGNTAAGQFRVYANTGGDDRNDTMYVNKFIYVERLDSASPFDEISSGSEKYRANIFLNLMTSTPMRRNNGN